MAIFTDEPPSGLVPQAGQAYEPLSVIELRELNVPWLWAVLRGWDPQRQLFVPQLLCAIGMVTIVPATALGVTASFLCTTRENVPFTGQLYEDGFITFQPITPE